MGIVSQKKSREALDGIPFAKRTDYIRLTAVTYQAFGLDKKGTIALMQLLNKKSH